MAVTTADGVIFVKSPVAWRKVGGVELEILVLCEALRGKMRSESEAGRREDE